MGKGGVGRGLGISVFLQRCSFWHNFGRKIQKNLIILFLSSIAKRKSAIELCFWWIKWSSKGPLTVLAESLNLCGTIQFHYRPILVKPNPLTIVEQSNSTKDSPRTLVYLESSPWTFGGQFDSIKHSSKLFMTNFSQTRMGLTFLRTSDHHRALKNAFCQLI